MAVTGAPSLGISLEKALLKHRERERERERKRERESKTFELQFKILYYS